MSNTMKMKFSYILFFVLDLPRLRGQQRIEEFQHFVLRLTFSSFYNSHIKSCCKLYPGGCYRLLDSAGYTCDPLRGRVSVAGGDGWMEFKISNVQLMDGGYYRCLVLGAENRIYNDYYVEVSEVSGHHTQSEPSLTTTTEAPSTSTTLPDSTGAVLTEDHDENPRVPWSFSLPLAVIVSISAMLFITSVVGLIFCKVKAARSAKYGATLRESLTNEIPQENSSIVYTTVDFRAHHRPTDVNGRKHKTPKGAPDSSWGAEHDGKVEYSTLAIHQ